MKANKQSSAAPAPQVELSELERVTTKDEPKALGAEPMSDEPIEPVDIGPTLEDCTGWASDGWSMAFGEFESAAPWLKFPDDVKERAVKKTAPVLFKYRDKLPDWFLRFREEIELGMFLGGLIYGGVKSYRDAKAAAEKNKLSNAIHAKPQATTIDTPQPVADNVTRTA